MKELIRDYWPLGSVVGFGLIAWGTLLADVRELQDQADTQKSDHDLIVEMRTEQKHIRTDIEDIKESVKDLANRRR